MFSLQYTVTDKILNNLTAIASAREVVEQASLVPKWEAKLRRQALKFEKYIKSGSGFALARKRLV